MEHLVRITDSLDLKWSSQCLCEDMVSEWTIKFNHGNHCRVCCYKQQTEGYWCLPGGGLSGDSREVQVNSPVVLKGNLIIIRTADPKWKNVVNAGTFRGLFGRTVRNGMRASWSQVARWGWNLPWAAWGCGNCLTCYTYFSVTRSWGTEPLKSPTVEVVLSIFKSSQQRVCFNYWHVTLFKKKFISSRRREGFQTLLVLA